MKFAQEAVAEGIRLYTSGVGTSTGAAVPDEFVEGVPVVTRLDENLLRRMATASATGRYQPVSQLAGLAGEINALERSALVSERQLVPVERVSQEEPRQVIGPCTRCAASA